MSTVHGIKQGLWLIMFGRTNILLVVEGYVNVAFFDDELSNNLKRNKFLKTFLKGFSLWIISSQNGFPMSKTCNDLLILPSYVLQNIVNVFHYTMTINVFSNHSPHVFSRFHVIPLSFLFINQCFFKCGKNCHGFIQRVNVF